MRNKKPTTTFDKIILALNILTTILLILSYFAAVISPRLLGFVAILGFGYPLLVPANAIFIPYWFLRSKKIYTLISAVSILIGYNFIMAYCGFHFGTKQTVKTKNAIRIMQYNVRAFGVFDGRAKPTQKGMYNLLRIKDPDIVNIEEFFSIIYDKGDISDSIKTIIQSKYMYFQPFKVTKKDSSGNAIFSKYPIIKYGSIAAQKSLLQTRAIFIDIKKGTDTIRIYCLHLAAVKIDDSKKTQYLAGKIPFDQTANIEKNLSQAFTKRSYQVEQIKRHIDTCPYPYIITGDFNDTPISYAVNTIGHGLKNAFKEKGSGLLKTFYSNYPLQIDFIFTSKQFDILNYQAIDNKLSDHKPIISDVVLKR